jgi:hypothetical protein
MKKYHVGLGLCVLLAVLLTACAGTPKPKNPGLLPTETESVITIARRDSSGLNARIGVPKLWDIYIDGEPVETIGKNQTVSFKIPNGSHSIYVFFQETKYVFKTNEIDFEAKSNTVSFSTYIAGMGVRAELRLFKKSGAE